MNCSIRSKKLKSATSEAVEQKLSSDQKKIIGFNKCLLLLHMNKGNEARELLQSLQQQFVDKNMQDDEGYTLILASLLLREKKIEEAEAMLLDYSRRHPSSTRAPLSLAQIHLGLGDISKVISTLEALEDNVKYRSGMVATRTALYEKQGNIDGAMRVLDDYVAWLDRNPSDSDEYVNCVRSAADYKLKHKRFQEAAVIYERLVKRNRNDMLSLPSLVIAASHFDTSLAEKYDARIPTLQGDSTMNGEMLENLPAPRLGGRQVSSDTSASAGSEMQQDKALKKKQKLSEKKKKKKKKKLPKNFNPAVTPDPERWLPKWQRSYYKKRQKKSQMGKGSQGVALPASVANPLSAAPVATTTQAKADIPPTASQSQNKGKGKQQAASKQNKKGKHGKR